MISETTIAPYGALPSTAHTHWYNTRLYALVHFSMNTFTGKEWGYGDDSPDVFNPTDFDAEQWALACKDAGLKGLILVAKHHDGFCLWPTKTTEYSVKNSSWKNGKGDVVAEVAAACKKYGLKFGVYCSPWDRNHQEYGREGYVEAYHEQIRELLSDYGPVFELWLDGANGGDGYYGGVKDRRSIDGTTYYQWDKVIKMVRELQPNAVIFGFDIRFVGNESGFAKETCWASYPCSAITAGDVPLGIGDRNGAFWMPAECDFPLRKGWFFHEKDKVKSSDKLVELYFKSIGRGCSMDIGLAPDKRGLIHDDELTVLKEWRQKIDKIFTEDLMQTIPVKVSASNIRDDATEFSPSHVIDGKPYTFWASDDNQKEPELIFEFECPVKFNVLKIAEFVNKGQRVDAFAIDIWHDDDWSELSSSTSIGYKRLLMVRTSETNRIRIRFTNCSACPLISTIAIYKASESMVLNGKIAIVRDQNGNVDIRSSNSGLAIHYTIDGSEPVRSSPLFIKPFSMRNNGTVKAIGFVEDAKTSIVSATFGCDRSDWKVLRVSLDSSFKNKGEAGVEKLLDDNPGTYWHTYHTDKKLSAPPHEVVLDMGSEKVVEAFTFMPNLGGDYGDDHEAIPDQYEFQLSLDDEEWDMVAEGEFSNIMANPCMQVVGLEKPVRARYLRFIAKHATNNSNYIIVAGIGVVEN